MGVRERSISRVLTPTLIIVTGHRVTLCHTVSVKNISCSEGVFSLTAELVPEVRKYYQFRLETRVECSIMGVSYECPNNISDVMFA